MKIRHFYHVWAGGAWIEPASEHVQALRDHGFCADGVTVGLVGSVEQISGAQDWFARELAETGPLDFVTAETGFEQLTLRVLHTWARNCTGEAAVLYAHTRGAMNPHQSNVSSRRKMTADVVTGWRDFVKLLETYDAAGPYWMHAPEWPHGFFGGNFWWARASYLAKLPELLRDMSGSLPPGTLGDCRWDAEVWLGLNDPNVHNLRPGVPS